MSKQTTPTMKDCQHRSVCLRPAVVGVFGWRDGDSDVDLNKPMVVFCGPHKPRLHRNQMLHMSGECLCGAFAHPGELKEIEFFYPATGKRLRDLQTRVRAAGFPWDWGTKPPASFIRQRAAEKHGQIPMLCSSCEARQS